MPLSPDLHQRLPKFCVALAAPTLSGLLAQAEAALADTTLLEFRLDSLTDPRAALPTLQRFLAQHPSVIALATCRRIPDGGAFPGTPAEELEILTSAATLGFHLVDLPIEAAEAAPPSLLQGLRSTGVALLLSHHDFTRTPDLTPVLTRALALQPDLVKLVPTAQTLSDTLPVLDLLRTHTASSPTPLLAISMGEPGLLTRILGPSLGSPFAFAASSSGPATAPGQLTASTLRSLFRADTLPPNPAVYGVVGKPVRHSLSPAMHNEAFAHLQLPAVYLPLPTDSLPDLLHLARSLPLHGFSITMPFKQSILPFLDHLEPLAARIGAVNTVHRSPEGKLLGSNTDIAGIVLPIERHFAGASASGLAPTASALTSDTPLSGLRALVLGAGGAARAAVFGLRHRGATVSILNRSPQPAEALAAESGATTLTRAQLPHEHFDVLINATPIGMSHHPSPTPEPRLPLPLEPLRASLVFDLVYTPLETPLIHLARQEGIPTILGVEMFLIQGTRQFELWTGQPAPEDLMRQTVLAALRQREADPRH